MNSIPRPRPHLAELKSINLLPSALSKIRASHKRNEVSPISRKGQKSPKRLIRISTSDGRWHGKWNLDYRFSLYELRLHDLAEEIQRDGEVFISLCIQKHAGFGLSVEGKIITSFTRKCSNCSSPYCREVLYVKPGDEIYFDSLIQDTIRLSSAVKETCSEACEKSEPVLQYVGAKYAASIDKRWSRLLEMKIQAP